MSESATWNESEFVTVVAVEAGATNNTTTTTTPTTNGVVPIDQEADANTASAFVTVLNITSDQPVTEEVLVYRLPGERLGFGLKFEGGIKTQEKVKRLFIQSCAVDSPASRAKCSWGSLQEGDEVLAIDGAAVNQMTRLDCVQCLKESHVVLNLVVSHVENSAPASAPTVVSEMVKATPPSPPPQPPPPPPPIPPRKGPRRQPKEPPPTTPPPPPR